MPFTGFDQKKLLNSQAVKKKKKESSSFAQKGHLPLLFHHFTKCITEKRGEKNPNFGGFNS